MKFKFSVSYGDRCECVTFHFSVYIFRYTEYYMIFEVVLVRVVGGDARLEVRHDVDQRRHETDNAADERVEESGESSGSEVRVGVRAGQVGEGGG